MLDCKSLISFGLMLITSDLFIYEIQTKIYGNLVQGRSTYNCTPSFDCATYDNISLEFVTLRNNMSYIYLEVHDLHQISRDVSILISNYSLMSRRLDNVLFMSNHQHFKIRRDFFANSEYLQRLQFKIRRIENSNFFPPIFDQTFNASSCQQVKFDEMLSVMNEQREDFNRKLTNISTLIDNVNDTLREEFNNKLTNMSLNHQNMINELKNKMNEQQEDFNTRVKIMSRDNQKKIDELHSVVNQQEKDFNITVINMSEDFQKKISQLNNTIETNRESCHNNMKSMSIDHENKMVQLQNVISKQKEEFKNMSIIHQSKIDNLNQELSDLKKELSKMELRYANLRDVQGESVRLTDLQSYFIIGFAVLFFLMFCVIWKLYKTSTSHLKSSQFKLDQVKVVQRRKIFFHICCFVTSEERQDFCNNQFIPRLKKRFPGLEACSWKANSIDEAEQIPSAVLYLLFLSEDARGMILESSRQSLRRFTLHKIRDEFRRAMFIMINEYNRKDSARKGQLYNESLVQVKSDPDLQELALQHRVLSYCTDLLDEHMTCLFNYISNHVPIN